MGFDRYVEELTHGADPDIAEPEIHFASKVTRDLSQRTDCLGIADVSWHHQHLRVQGETVRCDNLQILAAARGKHRAEERRVGKTCVNTCRYRWSQYQLIKNNIALHNSHNQRIKKHT